jgi:large subunit ribosomal protein L35
MPKMPKFKPKKALVKRLKVTGRGKLIARKPGASHLKSRKSPKRLRRMRKTNVITPQFERSCKRLMGLA